MENIAQLDEFLTNVVRFTAQYSFDKAKDICRKEKIMTNTGAYKDLLSLLPYMISVEKSYSEMGFLTAKSKVAVKKDNTLKSAYLEIKSDCEKIQPSEAEYERILKEIISWTEIRCQLIDSYNKMYTTATYNKHLKMQEFIDSLNSIVNNAMASYAPKTMANMKILIELETSCLLDLIYAQYFLENWNLVRCTSHISSAKSNLVIWENTLQNKETWRLNFLRMNTVPELYRWLIKFKTFLLEKFSVYFYMIIRQQTSVSDLKTICGKNRLEFLQKFQNISRKCGHETTSVMLVFDACGIKNWHGPGYRCPLKNTKTESPSTSYYVMLRHPEKPSEPLNVMPTIRRILVEHFSDILFLDRVVCRYISEENSTYFITSIEEKISLVAYYNSKKDDKQSDIDNYILELAWMIRSHRVFLSLNSNR
ncbi:KICSTOR subunit 2-like [Planococcus citri]|uniref:KICSTOR subunit 2-like n=1 Tax=Planococcus citri TaxID=170843 RepID=UPI0031F9DE9A